METVYDIIGEAGFERLVRGFYAHVPTDEILGPMYPPEDFEGAERRLRDFLVGRFGGPQRYIEERGHPKLRMRHAPFPIDEAARMRWLTLMDRSLTQAAFPEQVTMLLRGFFFDTSGFLVNR